MKTQSINNNNPAFGGNNIVKINKFSLAGLGQEVINAAESAASKLAKEGKGDNFVRIGQKYEAVPIYRPSTDPLSGTTMPDIGFAPTNEILVSARKLSKTLGEKIKLIFGFANYSEVVAKSTKEADIIEAGKEALNKLG